MHLERLLYQVSPPEFVDDFLIADSQVWNPWLQRQPGYITKSHRLLPNGLVELLIQWKSKKDRETAAASPDIRTLEAYMRQRSPGVYRLISSL